MKIQIYAPYSCQCSYSAKKEFGIFNPEVILVHDHEKDHYKIMNEMTTFPQIFFFVNGNRIKIGGYDDTRNLIEKIRNRENINIENISIEDKCVIVNFFTEKIANEAQLNAEFRERIYNDESPWISKKGI